MAQFVKRSVLDFGSGHDLMIWEIKPCVRLCTDNAEPAWDSHSSLSAPPLLVRALNLSLSLSLSLSRCLSK